MKKKILLALLSLVVLVILAGAYYRPDSQALFLTSIKTGNIDAARIYLSQNREKINNKMFDGVTPLQSAIDSKQQEMARFLIESGADIKMPFKDGSTPLHHAAYLDEESVVELLLSHGIAVDNNWGLNTPLEMAAETGSIKAASILIEHGANVNGNKSANPLRASIARNQLEMAKLLLAKGALCDYRESGGNTYLHMHPGYALPNKQAGNLAFIDLFLSCGIDVNSKNNIGETPLHTAFAYGDQSLQLAERLVAHGADVNARSNKGFTPLLNAAYHGRLDLNTLRFLLEHGADVLAQDDKGLTALQYVSKAGSVEVGTLLIEKGGGVNEAASTLETPLSIAIDSGNLDFASMLISQGAKVNTLGKDQSTLMDLAIRHNNIAAARLLLESGIVIQVKSGRDGGGPLLHAVKAGNLEIARLLIEKKADVNTRDNTGMSSLHWATKDGRQELVQLLLSHGADVGAQDNRGLTPIRMASSPITELLVANGAVRPPALNPDLGNLACQSVVTSANNGTLSNLLKGEFAEGGLIHRVSEEWEDDELGSIESLSQIEVDGAHYLLGMAGEVPIYLSRVDTDKFEELVCRIGRKDVAGYFVRSPAEVAASRLLRQEGVPSYRIPPIAESISGSLAEGAEIHVVSGYAVEAQKGNKAGSNVVNVKVDRPGKKVLLVLNSYDAVEWQVKPSADTNVTGILVSSLRSNGAGSVSTVVSTSPVYQAQIPFALYELESPNFGRFLSQLNEWSGVRQVSSFFGKYYIPALIEITRSDVTADRLSLDYPPIQAVPVNLGFDLYDTGLLPIKWGLSGPLNEHRQDTSYLGNGRFAVLPNGKEAYLLHHDQFIFLDLKTGSTSNFALPSGFPAMSWAIGLAYDTQRNIVSVASHGAGGEGFFYRFDHKARHWLDFHSLKDIDSFSLAYDEVSDQYVAWTDKGELLFISANGEMGRKQEVESLLPGFKRFYTADDKWEHLMEIKPRGKDVALIGFWNDKVVSVWHYNLASNTAQLTYKIQRN